MEMRKFTSENIDDFETHLNKEEKSPITIEKYMRDVKSFYIFADGREVTKELVMEYKKHLVEQNFAVSSINSMLAAVNSFLSYMGWTDCRVKNLRTQKKIYCEEEKVLTKAEYLRLLKAASSKPRLYMVLQTICGTGIRVSELSYFTVEAVKTGEIHVSCKNKTRSILIPKKLKKLLLNFAKKNGIKSGYIFQTKSGKPLDRSNIWTEMKKLCKEANVKNSKVFPHNLRKLFARTFYTVEKDIAKLADVLGHSNINTTRIYIMSSGLEHLKKIEKLGLVVDKISDFTRGDVKTKK